MAGTTVVPSSLLPRRSAAAAADLHSSCSRVRLNPASMANPAAAKTPKRPVSVRDGQPPAPKRVRGASSRDELHVTGPANIKNSSKIPCPSSGNDPRSPTCLHASVIKNQVAESPSSATQSKPPISMRELIENARLAMAPAAAEERMVDMDWAHPAVEEEASPRRDIERSRAEARRKVEQMVDTVQFNDPYIDPSDVTRSPEELLQARQEAWRVQAQLIEMAHRRNMHGDVAQVM